MKKITILLIAMFALSATAVPVKYTTANGGNWNGAGVFSPDATPVAGDTVVITGQNYGNASAMYFAPVGAGGIVSGAETFINVVAVGNAVAQATITMSADL